MLYGSLYSTISSESGSMTMIGGRSYRGNIYDIDGN